MSVTLKKCRTRALSRSCSFRSCSLLLLEVVLTSLLSFLNVFLTDPTCITLQILPQTHTWATGTQITCFTSTKVRILTHSRRFLICSATFSAIVLNLRKSQHLASATTAPLVPPPTLSDLLDTVTLVSIYRVSKE